MKVEYTESSWDEDRWPNFSYAEIADREGNGLWIEELAMDALQKIRKDLGFALNITSAYRSPLHSIEAAKSAPGTHTYGVAFDISCRGSFAYRILHAALEIGFTGIGVKQTGPREGRFLHIDMMNSTLNPDLLRPVVWSY
jgi:hypothetical protein|tara:strand:+ start:521 stop:940 length:420 start_codon:yes stop_codon:yes gene_type:complete